MAANYIFLFALIAGTVCAQSELPNLQDLENVSLPPELQGKVDPKEIERIQNKSLTEFMQRCEKNGGPEAFNKSKNAAQDLQKCLTGLVDQNELQAEIEKAKPNGEVDEVFKKYCAKKPQFEACVKDVAETTKACLSPDEQIHLKTVYNVSQQLVDFICFKDGDRIALFIAEGGQECFQDKQDPLKSCFNELKASQNFTLSFDDKQCKQLAELQGCVVGVLEGCPKPTSANIVESLFKFIRKATPCKSFAEATTGNPNRNSNTEPTPKSESGAPGMSVATATIIMAAIARLI